MTHIMAKIRFTEPTLIALTGHHFEACTENMKIKPYKLYLVEKEKYCLSKKRVQHPVFI